MAKEMDVKYTANDKDAGMGAEELREYLNDALNDGLHLPDYTVKVVAGWGGKVASIKLVRKPDAGRR